MLNSQDVGILNLIGQGSRIYFINQNIFKINGILKTVKMPGRKQKIGLIEPVTLKGSKSSAKCLARIDTGAVRSSMDASLATGLGLGPVIFTRLIKSANGSSVRPVVHGELVLADKKIEGTFNLADRSHLRFKVLIGQNILIDNGFLIDPDKKTKMKIEDEE
jgi:hypothetical protein